LSVRARFIHADAALAGLPLGLLDPSERPGFDFADGADTISISGHKFPGSPSPSGVVVARRSLCDRYVRNVSYTGSPDTTIAGSRSGHAALILWYALNQHGVAGHRRRAQESRALAAYTHAQLHQLGWPAYRHPLAFTVVLRTPPEQVLRKGWVLAASDNGWCHLMTMPGITIDVIQDFLADMSEAIADARRPSDRPVIADDPAAVTA
jgi:histidine decarboxylase